MQIGDVWFDEPIGEVDADLLRYHQRAGPSPVGSWHPFDSLVIDLPCESDELLKGFDKGTRYEIRRAETSDALCQLWWDGKPPKETQERFLRHYAAMGRRKGIPPLSAAVFEAYQQSGRLQMTAVANEDEILVWHTYVLTRSRVRLLQSCSGDGDDRPDAKERARRGRANRWLHWQDMLRFSERGFGEYDLGGLYTGQDRGRQSVSRFKRGFGGRPEQRWDGEEVRSRRGAAYVGLRRLLSRPRTGHDW